jgi:hypothetical protein
MNGLTYAELISNKPVFGYIDPQQLYIDVTFGALYAICILTISSLSIIAFKRNPHMLNITNILVVAFLVACLVGKYLSIPKCDIRPRILFAFYYF